jgi:23S rRNA (cytidine1920-2'-O)/16S rRNA (cytidine1409-2'-O)-methyltransferase
MSPRRRADIVLVERGLFESRAKAQAAIAAGLVRASGMPIRKASEPIAADAVISADPAFPWVSRGGIKLADALDRVGLAVTDRVCLDVGASTGGFTQVLLARDAAVHRVVCAAIADFAASLGCANIASFPSPIAGADGNRESFIGAELG